MDTQDIEIMPAVKVPKADWTRSLECLLLLALVAGVAVTFMSTTDTTIHTFWTGIVNQLHTALTQAHMS